MSDERPAGTAVSRSAAAHAGHELLGVVLFGGRRRRVYRRLAAISGARPGDRVLDVGCGTGYLTRMLAGLVAPDGTARGIDPSEEAVGKAHRRNRLSNCTFDVGTAQRLDAPDRCYDVLVTTLAIHHIPEVERPAAFAQMYRVLRPGGTLLVAEFRPPTGRLSRRLVSGHSPAMGAIRPDELEALIRGAGFVALGAGGLRPWIHWARSGKPQVR